MYWCGFGEHDNPTARAIDGHKKTVLIAQSIKGRRKGFTCGRDYGENAGLYFGVMGYYCIVGYVLKHGFDLLPLHASGGQLVNKGRTYDE